MTKQTTAPSGDPVKEISKRLERNLAYGHRASEVFDDWLALVYHTLRALPAHLASAAATGRPAEDTPETQAVWARLRTRYPQPAAWTNFVAAFAVLLDATEGFWVAGVEPARSGGFDVLGSVYMELAANPHAGQFFTPWPVASMMAQVTIDAGGAEVLDRLRQAHERAAAREDANAALLAATVLAGLAIPDDRPDLALDHLVTRVLPLIRADYAPITICDPCCGSGILLLTAARRYPAWMCQSGLVQFYGMDIDATCVTMARCNLLLYGIGGDYHHLTPALQAAPAELAALPEPFAAAYTLAQAAQAAGDSETVLTIARDLRQQQALFDPAEYTVHNATAKPAAQQSVVRRPAAPEPALTLAFSLD